MSKNNSKRQSKKNSKKKEMSHIVGGAGGAGIKDESIISFTDSDGIECYYDKMLEIPVDNVIVKNLTLINHGKTLIEKSDMNLLKGNRYGLVGPNGCGKTTILKCLLKRIISVDKKLNIVEVEQTFETSVENVYNTVLKMNSELYNVMSESKELEIKEEMTDKELDKYNELSEKLDELDVSSNDSKIRKVLKGLGFSDEDILKPTNAFSGGWQRRIALAKVLYLNPDVLLLDEPTNHLDLESVIWLGEFLSDYKGIMMVISHSADFVDIVCNRTLFILDNMLKDVKGNYTNGKRLLQKEREKLDKDYVKLEKKIRSTKNLTKKLKQEMIEKANLPERVKRYVVRYPKYESLEIKGDLLKMENVSFNYDEKMIIKNMDFTIKMGERYTLVGRNGVGKTTFLKLILGKERPKDGYVIKHGALRIGYYHQHFDKMLPEDETAIDYLLKYMSDDFDFKGEPIRSIREYMGRLKLDGRAQTQKMGTLSGGQKAKIAWLVMIFMKPHLILLDEPTNHLDIPAIESMMESLDEYNGSLLLVSHDPTLVRGLETELLVMDDGKFMRRMDYDEYVESM